MKKKNVINLIRYYSEKNDAAFREEAYEIARDFDACGDTQLSEHIMALMSSANTFVPQTFLKKEEPSQDSLLLPTSVEADVVSVIKAIRHNVGVNRFLFRGAPGTGKKEAVRHIARILEKELFYANLNAIAEKDPRKARKNFEEFVNELNHVPNPKGTIILLDDIAALKFAKASERELLCNLNHEHVIIAVENSLRPLDKSETRLFDSVVDFNRYTQEDLKEIAEKILQFMLSEFKIAETNARLFKKILAMPRRLPVPGILKKMLKDAVALSDTAVKFDYMRKVYEAFTGKPPANLQKLQKQGFTIREIEIISGISKSQVGRELKNA